MISALPNGSARFTPCARKHQRTSSLWLAQNRMNLRRSLRRLELPHLVALSEPAWFVGRSSVQVNSLVRSIRCLKAAIRRDREKANMDYRSGVQKNPGVQQLESD
jgi:hypothetical protein